MYVINIFFYDGTYLEHRVNCECPNDWVVSNYHHNDFWDFTFYQAS